MPTIFPMIKSFSAKLRKKTSAILIAKGLLFRVNHQNGPTTIDHFLIRCAKGKEAKLCENIVRYDGNALYFWAIMQDMSTGSYSRRREQTNFKRESSSRMADDWIQ